VRGVLGGGGELREREGGPSRRDGRGVSKEGDTDSHEQGRKQGVYTITDQCEACQNAMLPAQSQACPLPHCNLHFCMLQQTQAAGGCLSTEGNCASLSDQQCASTTLPPFPPTHHLHPPQCAAP
jgi:hypothetical protein